MKNTEKNIIIQCPECHTKFSVERAKLLKLNIPQLHCSKCDNVFSFSIDEIRPAENIINQEDREKHVFTRERHDTSNFVVNAQNQKDNIEIKDSDNQNDEEDDYNNDFYGINKNRSAFPSKRTSAFLRKDNYDISGDEDEEQESNVKIENYITRNDNTEKQDDTNEDSSTLDSWLSKKANEFSMTFKNDNKEEDNEDEDIIQTSKGRNHQWEDDAFTPIYKDKINSENDTKYSKRQVRSWGAVFKLSFPLCIFLLVLCFCGFYLQENKDIFNKLNLNIINSNKIAPVGVYLKNVKIFNKTLNNGEKIKLIRGRIVNDSQYVINDVILDSFLYNGEDSIISEKMTNASSQLADHKSNELLSLNSEMIENFQSSRTIKRRRIAPGDQIMFAVAFTDSNIFDSAKKYATRIYSVKY